MHLTLPLLHSSANQGAVFISANNQKHTIEHLLNHNRSLIWCTAHTRFAMFALASNRFRSLFALAASLSFSSALVQITQPAPRSKTLALSPSPNLRWVYSSTDPPTLAILIQHSPSDENATVEGFYRRGTPTEWGTVPLQFEGSNFKEGMNISIWVLDGAVDPKELENGDWDGQKGNGKVLDGIGPLLLVDGHHGVVPISNNGTVGSSGTGSAPNASTTTMVSASNATTSSKPTDSDEAQSTTSETHTAEHGSTTITDSPTEPTEGSPSQTTATTSEANKLFAASALYVAVMVLLGVPAFWIGLRE